MILIMVPFTVFYYEGEDADDSEDGPRGTAGQQFAYALKYIIPTLVFFAAIVAGMYYGGLAYATINTTYLQSPMYDTTDLETKSLDAFFSFSFYCNSSANGVPISLNPKIPVIIGGTYPTFSPSPAAGTNSPDFLCPSVPTSNGLTAVCCSTPVVNSVVVSPLVFIVAVLTLLGWAIFSVFCGVGMAALPYDMLHEFKHRPRPITATHRKRQVGEQATILMEEYKTLTQELKQAARGNNFSRKYRTIKNRENQFRKNVMILEYHYKNLEDGYRFQGGNIILQYAKFLFACLGVILTLLWIIHCALYVIPQTLKNQGLPINPIDGFLNNMLNMTKDIPIVGIALYSLFVFYLFACVIKGNHKVGMRVVFFTIHPLM
ncbi:hypothetical protein HDU91_007013 [Kappamyces sp. JEL0680]|nr:hypothetical protein HDU91_007013 [Kappamyces sp. JEL0680]